jgi:hypothetical protein
LTPFFGRDSQTTSIAWGATIENLVVSTWRYGLRAVYRTVLDEHLTLVSGFDGLASNASLSRKGSMTVPAREGDLSVFGQPPSDDVAYDTWSVLTLDAGLFTKADLTFGPFSITPGLRLSAIGVDGSRLTPRVAVTPSIGYSTLDWNVEPRLALAVALSSKVTATASAGLYHQAPDPADRSSVFGSPLLGPEAAIHLVSGVAVEPTESLSVEATGFYKSLSDLVVRNPDPTPQRAQALLQDGVGRAYGGQVRIRQRLWKGFSGWIAYTLSHSERRDSPDGPWRLFDTDQTHGLTVSGTQAIGNWRIGARIRWATGCPRTPVVGSYYDARQDFYQPIFGGQNSDRLPDYFQVDLQAERIFRLSDGITMQAYLEILNVTNHKNVEEVVYNADYSQHGYLTGLPLFGTLGARLSF